jgi:hypothetical protein
VVVTRAGSAAHAAASARCDELLVARPLLKSGADVNNERNTYQEPPSFVVPLIQFARRC